MAVGITGVSGARFLGADGLYGAGDGEYGGAVLGTGVASSGWREGVCACAGRLVTCWAEEGLATG